MSTQTTTPSDKSWSPAIEDYVKAIWSLAEEGEQATGQAIAQRLDVSQASVTNMVQRLAELELVTREPYKPVVLTDRGRLVALEVVRHHRLIELFLAESLGMGWDRIHAEAEILEHHISEELEDRIAEHLGDPQFDPHGHPIPRRDGTMPDLDRRPLVQAQVGEHVRIEQVRDDRPELLRWLQQRGLVVGATLAVSGNEPLAGTVAVAVDGDDDEHVLGRELARRIDVAPAEEG